MKKELVRALFVRELYQEKYLEYLLVAYNTIKQ